jgi:hypothetical protein
MAGRVTWRNAIIGAAAVALVITTAVLVARGPADEAGAPADEILGQNADSKAPSDAAASADPGGAATGMLVATVDDSEIVPPKNTKKSSPAPTTPSDGTPPAPSPDEQAYLDETRKVVETNEGDLAVVAEMIARALGSGDEDFFEQLVSDGESQGAEVASQLANDYPSIDTYELGSNVNVFSTGQTTLYFAYALVTWTDGGVPSEHTIPIVLRYIDGEWRLSTLGEANPDLVFVQSVDL